ncbi:hypothetical protein ABT126_45140 [Streptomyces sp. NPDC002012]|uniref:hypothetical protein n=1 Tax=unclassified Streptomyces TaxID=2593676 RepID=UPI003323AC94
MFSLRWCHAHSARPLSNSYGPTELVRPHVLVLDAFAMRRLSAAHADDLHELVSE